MQADDKRPTPNESHRAAKSPVNRLFDYFFKATGYWLFGRVRLPPNRMGAEDDAFLRRAFELEDEPESGSGLPEAELSAEEQRKAQEEFREKHQAP